MNKGICSDCQDVVTVSCVGDDYYYNTDHPVLDNEGNVVVPLCSGSGMTPELVFLGSSGEEAIEIEEQPVP